MLHLTQFANPPNLMGTSINSRVNVYWGVLGLGRCVVVSIMEIGLENMRKMEVPVGKSCEKNGFEVLMQQEGIRRT